MKSIYFLLLMIATSAWGQMEAIKKGSNEKITIDGKMNESVWQRMPKISNFKQSFPEDNKPAVQQTMVWMTYDDKYFYVAAKCFDNQKGPFQIQSLRRDSKGKSDKFEILLDPYGENTNGYVFGVSPNGVEREGFVTNGSEVDLRWDCRWSSAVKVQPGFWIVEMKIPFHALNYQKYSSSWRVNFLRYDYKNNEISSAVQIPRNFDTHNLATTQPLKWHNTLGASPFHFSIIPYVAAGIEQLPNTPTKVIQRVGGDAKVRIGSSLNLDLTINPDFSQVEADRQITNLSRFELQFEERRQFFIENNDLFGGFGFEDINPFFSRRVGVGRDPFTGQFKQQPIAFGAKFAGKIDESTRVGVMSVQTAAQPTDRISAQNYTVLSAQKNIGKFSRIGLIGINREKIESKYFENQATESNHNRVVGLDYDLISKNNSFRGKFFVHQLFRPQGQKGGTAHGGRFEYNSKYFEADWQHEVVSKNYRPDFGFVRQKDYYAANPEVRASYYFKKKSLVNKVSVGLNYENLWDLSTNKLYENHLSGKLYLKFQNLSYLRLYLTKNYIYLFEAFDPTNTKLTKLPIGDYNFNHFAVKYESDKRKKINGYLNLKAGGYFSGKILSASGNLNQRFQPNGEAGLDVSVNSIQMPQPYASRTLLLIGPHVDWAFNKSMFLKSVVQYNTQINNINTNVRFQWRYKPVSDFYFVIANNYSDRLKFRNLDVMFKINHWFG